VTPFSVAFGGGGFLLILCALGFYRHRNYRNNERAKVKDLEGFNSTVEGDAIEAAVEKPVLSTSTSSMTLAGRKDDMCSDFESASFNDHFSPGQSSASYNHWSDDTSCHGNMGARLRQHYHHNVYSPSQSAGASLDGDCSASGLSAGSVIAANLVFDKKEEDGCDDEEDEEEDDLDMNLLQFRRPREVGVRRQSTVFGDTYSAASDNHELEELVRVSAATTERIGISLSDDDCPQAPPDDVLCVSVRSTIPHYLPSLPLLSAPNNDGSTSSLCSLEVSI
jgi:hypothetical protein